MLPPNVTANLDYLASLGVLDYDAAAHIAGTKPRFYGSPQHYIPPVVMTPMDSFTPSSSVTTSSNPFAPVNAASSTGSWLGLMGKAALGLGGLYLGGKVFLKVAKGIKNFSLKGIFSKSKKTVTNAASNIPNPIKKSKLQRLKNSISGAWNKIFSRKKIRLT